MYVPQHLELIKIPDKGYGVIAKKAIQKGEIVCELFFDSIRPRTFAVSAVQIWENDFLSNTLRTIDDYFNHSCNPTTKIDLSRAIFTALKYIPVGEEITWNYLTTEYDLVRNQQDFDCRCGAKNCIRKVQGFRYLNHSSKQMLLPYLSSYLRIMMP